MPGVAPAKREIAKKRERAAVIQVAVPPEKRVRGGASPAPAVAAAVPAKKRQALVRGLWMSPAPAPAPGAGAGAGVEWWGKVAADVAAKAAAEAAAEAESKRNEVWFPVTIKDDSLESQKLILSIVLRVLKENKEEIFGERLSSLDLFIFPEKYKLSQKLATLLVLFEPQIIKGITAKFWDQFDTPAKDDIMLAAVINNAHVLNQHPSYTENKQFMLRAIKANKQVACYLNSSLQNDPEILRVTSGEFC